MMPLSLMLFSSLSAFFRSRYSLSLEILALRQQLYVLKRKHPRPWLRIQDRLFWIFLRRLWFAWSDVLITVKPQTVAAWHRAGFGAFDREQSSLSGQRSIPRFEFSFGVWLMSNPTWGAPRVHGELLKLGFNLSERAVSRYIRRVSPRGRARKLWATFLRNHRDVLVAMDFFTVPTLTFRVLYCFFVIEHGRRKILHFNGTDHPTGPWIVQQLREAFPETCPYRYLILNRDGKFREGGTDFLLGPGMKPTRISPANPWQNGVAGIAQSVFR